MNRLIIIGNGFDLAHGIKTSYHDFILDYIKQSCILAFNDGLKTDNVSHYQLFYFKDELIEIRIGTRFNKLQVAEQLLAIETIEKLIEYIKSVDIKINYYFELLKNGINKLTEYNWVDFEIEYFEELHKIKSKGVDVVKKIRILNENFDFFKNILEEYLRKKEADFYHNFDREMLVDCFCEKILNRDVDIISIDNQLPSRMLFLNFNYTNTLEPYLRDCNQKIPSNITYIHGSLNYDVGKPIFGFGDEIDKRYSEFENEGNNELFKHIKTFEYLKTNNYSNLTRFLSIEEFQVQIYGHSCGLSDRTMLKEIFEHSNCVSIKIFYHDIGNGINDYTEKTYEIYRHFSDKNMMRNKVVNEKYCRAMPQPMK